jgi:hypothetical protein
MELNAREINRLCDTKKRLSKNTAGPLYWISNVYACACEGEDCRCREDIVDKLMPDYFADLSDVDLLCYVSELIGLLDSKLWRHCPNKEKDAVSMSDICADLYDVQCLLKKKFEE